MNVTPIITQLERERTALINLEQKLRAEISTATTEVDHAIKAMRKVEQLTNGNSLVTRISANKPKPTHYVKTVKLAYPGKLTLAPIPSKANQLPSMISLIHETLAHRAPAKMSASEILKSLKQDSFSLVPDGLKARVRNATRERVLAWLYQAQYSNRRQSGKRIVGSAIDGWTIRVA
jgi:hypothetical protein